MNEHIKIQYQTNYPMIAQTPEEANMYVDLNCSLSHNEWGMGIARGQMVAAPGGILKGTVVLTFPDILSN